MSRTVDEKLQYNRQRKTSFSVAYCFGVSLYRDYPQADAESKALIRQIIDNNKQFARDGDQYAKGFMCGVRDAANERKARKGK